MLKRIAFFGILFIPFFMRAYDPGEIVSAYEATWDGPFFTILLGKVGGYLPERFLLREATWRDSHGKEAFFLGLDDNRGKAWVRLHSNTTRESAIWLPRKRKEVLMNSSAVRFVKMLQELFGDSSRHVMKGVFSLGKKKISATADEYALSGEEARRFGPARAFTVLTFDSVGTPDIRGRVVVTKDSALHYRKIAVYFPNNDIGVILEERREK